MINRSFLHLTNPTEGSRRSEESCTQSLKVVEELFGIGHLKSDKSKSKLSDLWKRTDFLATNQLITLGDSILRLQSQEQQSIQDWLESCASSSKRDKNGHGFIKEILVASYFGKENNSVDLITASKGQQAYDMQISKNGFDFFISVKNFGKSDKEKTFIKCSNRLFNLTKNKSILLKKSLNLRIFHQDVFDEQDLEAYEKEIKQFSVEDIGKVIKLEKGELSFVEIKNEVGYQANVIAKQANNEQKRFLQKIIKEIINMRKFFADKPEAIRLLFVRVDDICNLQWLKTQLKDYSQQQLELGIDLGIDVLIIQQSAVLLTSSSSSTTAKGIYHVLSPVDFRSKDPRIIKYAENNSDFPLSLEFPIGQLLDLDEIPRKTIDIDPELDTSNMYVYQKGVYKREMQKESDGSYSSTIYDALPEGISIEIELPKSLSNNNRLSVLSKGVPPHDILDII